MPELPEVETIRRGLETEMVGEKIIDASFLWPKILKRVSKKKFKENALDKEILAVKRRAKIIIIELENENKILFHMKMTGHLLIKPDAKEVTKDGRWKEQTDDLEDPFNQYIRAIFWLSNGKIIAFSDLRKFGYIKLLNNSELGEIINKLGPEPFSSQFNQTYLEEIFSKKNVAIKKVLMDQSSISGIGNIYADEVLFASKIHPEKQASSLTGPETALIIKNTRQILDASIKNRGTSTSDFRDTSGAKGAYEKKLKVYRRTGQPCPTCGAGIEKIVVGGRGTHLCPKCQVKK